MSIANEDLVRAAKEARRNAYARYSGFLVGTALIEDQSRLHVGCNVENAAYSLGNCADAGAIASMVQEGGRRIRKIAVIGGSGEISPCTPCGGVAASASPSLPTRTPLSSPSTTVANGRITRSVRCYPRRSTCPSRPCAGVS